MAGIRFWGVEWTDGLAGNLVAEALGVFVGALFTLLVVDWVLRQRLRQERRPLRQRLAEEITGSRNHLVFCWALTLNLLDSGAMKETADDDYAVLAEQVKREMSRLTQIKDFTDRLNRVANGSMTIATNTIDCVHRISRAADRLAQVLGDDVQLQARVADVESYGHHLEDMVRRFNQMKGSKNERRQEEFCVSSCQIVFERIEQLHNHLRDASSTRRETG